MTAVSNTAVNGSLSLACQNYSTEVRSQVEPAIRCDRTSGCMGASNDATGSYPFTLCTCPSDLSPHIISVESTSVLYIMVYGFEVPGKQHLSPKRMMIMMTMMMMMMMMMMMITMVIKTLHLLCHRSCACHSVFCLPSGRHCAVSVDLCSFPCCCCCFY